MERACPLEMTSKQRGLDPQPLIVSYSYSGNTHQIARGLQKATGGDWCVPHPRQPYPMAFSELLEQVRGEIQSGYCPGLLSDVRSPRAYSMIFAGSPNWCGTIAPPLASWLKQYDLNGKIISSVLLTLRRSAL